MEAEIYCINNGEGCGFTCPHCLKDNWWVHGEDEIHYCTSCKREVGVKICTGCS